jgi:OTT_1508-like deaminase
MKIKAPGQRAHSMPKRFLEVVNNYAVSQGKPRVQWQDLCNAFPPLKDRPEPPEGDIKVTTSVHCECTIATYLLKKTLAQPKVCEIGISKRSCWLCQRYLEFLVEPDSDLAPTQPSRFIVSGYQGKIHSGWQPPVGPEKAARRMVGLITHEMDEILEGMARTNRSDSFPRSPDMKAQDMVLRGGFLSKFFKD